jgi:hypothetical protein
MFAKVGIVAAAAVASLLSVSPLAFAHDTYIVKRSLFNISDNNFSMPVQACNNSFMSGTLGIFARHLESDDSHGGDCHQKSDTSHDEDD